MEAVLTAVAYHLPEKVLTNVELSSQISNFSAIKIQEKTGIIERRIASPDECASDLGFKAAEKLFATGKHTPQTVDFILFNTQSPDYLLPSSACLLQNRLGIPISAGALDFNLGCSGYVYGLALAKGLIAAGIARTVLLISAETYTKYIHPGDRSTRSLFGDGAAASLITASERKGIGEFELGTDGRGGVHLIVPTGGARHPRDAASGQAVTTPEGYQRTGDSLFMNGPEIFNFTLETVPRSFQLCLEKNRLTPEEIDLFVFHQANRHMLDFLRKICKIPEKRFYINLERVGNTVSASIPIALCMAEADGVLRPGMKVMLIGFGVGLSWGAVVIDWLGMDIEHHQ